MARSPKSHARTTDGNERATPSGRTPKISEITAQRIVSDIAERSITSGNRLPLEAEMMAEYGVSRASLREALRLLEVQGLIHLKPGPGGGPIVGEVDARNLARTTALYLHMGGMTYHDLLLTQVDLEPLCAEGAARHPDVEAKRAAFAPYLDGAHPGDTAEFEALAVDFHDLVFSFCENKVLALLSRSVSHVVASHVVAEMDPTPVFDRISHDHSRLAHHIVDGDTSRAHREMREHYQSLMEHYLATWPERLSDLVQWR